MGDRIRAVLAGCGSISHCWLDTPAVKDRVDLVGLVDLDTERARAVAEKSGRKTAAIGTELGPILDDTRPDAVFDCTVPEAHHAVTLEALRHGCHVLGEKPMADTMEHAREMVDAARQAGKTYAVIQNRRYLAPLRRVKRFLASGAIGDITTAHCQFFLGPHFGGFRDHMKHVLLLDMAIHTFDAARAITGADPVNVFCSDWNPKGSWFDQDAAAVAFFEMTGGIRYTYLGSWCADGMNTTWESQWRIMGERGSLVWDGGEGFKAQKVNKTEAGKFFSEWVDVPLPESDPGDRIGGHNGVIAEFLECVRTGKQPETICTDNIKSLAMVQAAIQSAESGLKVPIVA